MCPLLLRQPQRDSPGLIAASLFRISVTFAQFRYFFLSDARTEQLIHSPWVAVEPAGRRVDPQVCPSPSGEGHCSPAPVETAGWYSLLVPRLLV
jgi:hypothetical protein